MRVLTLAVLVSLVSCAPIPGDACAPVDGAICDPSGKGWLVCDPTGHLQGFGCLGPSGCATNPATKTTFCDMRGADLGAACPRIASGVGFCAGPVTFRFCDGAKFVEKPCGRCEQSGLAATCHP